MIRQQSQQMTISAFLSIALGGAALLGIVVYAAFPTDPVRPVSPQTIPSNLQSGMSAASQPSSDSHPGGMKRTVSAKARTASADIESLLSSGRPTANLQAFEIMERCVQLKRIEKINNSLPSSIENIEFQKKSSLELPEEHRYCSTINQRQLMDRIELLRVALSNKIAGAGVAFYNAGPNGEPDDLTSRPDDPIVKEWRLDAISYLKQDADLGNRDALALLSDIYQGTHGDPKDIGSALGYQLALRDIDTAAGRTTGRERQNQYIAALQNQATESQIIAAKQLARSIFEKCCRK